MTTSLKGTIWGGVVFSASPATVSVPTGSTTISAGIFTVPEGVNVIKLYIDHNIVYVGVTPKTKHKINVITDVHGDEYFNIQVYCVTHNITYMDIDSIDYIETVDISWSPEINKKTPTITDY